MESKCVAEVSSVVASGVETSKTLMGLAAAQNPGSFLTGGGASLLLNSFLISSQNEECAIDS
jgi:hypothetical protein